MKHFVRITLVALSLFSVPVLAEASQQPAPTAPYETLTLKAGSVKTLHIPGLTRLALGNVEFAEVSAASDGAIRIEGLKAGETTLLVWTGSARKEYRIVVQN